MQIRSALLGLTALAGLVLPASGGRVHSRDRLSPRRVPPSHTIHERHSEGHLEGWVKRDLVQAESTLPVRIGLRQSNVDAGHEKLMDISNPRSPNYGKHLSRSEVIELFAPHEHSVENVKRWLVSAGIDEKRLSRSANKQWIQFDAPAHEVEDLLLTKFHVFENLKTGVKNIACSEYHVPHNVSGHIDYITPGIKLMSGGNEEKITKRMLESRHLTGDLGGKARNGGKGRKGGKGKGKGGSKPTKGPAPSKASCTRRPTVTPTSTPTVTPTVTPTDTATATIVDPVQSPSPSVDNSIFKVTGPCSDEITPQCIRTQYQIPNGTKAAKGNELGIFQGLNQHYSQEDLDTYFKYIAPWVPQGTHPELRSINGATGPTNDTTTAGDEADLDFEVAIPLIWPQKTVLFQTDDEWYQKDQLKAGSKYPGFFNTFFDALDESYCHLSAFNETGNCASDACRDPEYPNPNAASTQGGYHGALMCGRYPPTNVISISYSGTEHSWPASYMRRQCLEIMKLGLQGVTVVESSGDYGVGGRWLNPTAGCLGDAQNVFSPRVMGNCPYVLSVGATALVEPEYVSPSEVGKLVEVAAESFASGGGFSNVFERPKWQDKHVQGYLDKTNSSAEGYVNVGGLGFASLRPPPAPGKLFNIAGRAYPDVAAMGENFRVVLRAYPNRMHGTSVSTPIWASILTLLNEERLAVGKSSIGFVHQVFYEHPEVFTDITEGSNPGCGADGFEATEGWDPVTGLGTPNFPKLRDLFLRLP